jgi:hypothetical protein
MDTRIISSPDGKDGDKEKDPTAEGSGSSRHPLAVEEEADETGTDLYGR